MPTSPNPPDPLDSSDTETTLEELDQSSLVVVGSSAGGIEALSKLVSTLPGDFPAPLVLAQHLDPTQPSHLGEILARYSKLPVRTVRDHSPLEVGTIYVIPSDRNVQIGDQELRLQSNGPTNRPMPSINLLFTSAARAFGERLIAVILTGTGSDGASGAYEVKMAGGTVIIENPETAAYPALPASLSPSTVDYVVDLERVGPLLYEVLTTPTWPLAHHIDQLQVSPANRAPAATPTQAGATPEGTAPGLAPQQVEQAEKAEALDRQSLQYLLQQVQEHAHIDFSQYKLPTILRRLHRRMFATNSPNYTTYVHSLESHPDEYAQLVSSFLIKVTEFFRDPQFWDALKERVLPDLIAQARTHGNVLRLWSAGCATGEEAYSLAMLVAEALGAELDQFSVQIFATDVDEPAIEYARHGIYPAAALEHIPPQRRERYFRKLDGNFEINKSIRGLVIFGLHDLGAGPPFPRIDLVLCRNVLMYFTRDLQARALQAFAYSLRSGGYLGLGTAESTSSAAEYFAPISPMLKLYRRVGDRVLFPIAPTGTLPSLVEGGRLSSRGARLGAASVSARARASASGRLAAAHGGKRLASDQELVLQEARNTRERLGMVVLGLPVGVVVVDRHYDIQIINEVAMRLLDIYTEPIGEDLIHLAASVPEKTLQQAIDAAFRRELWPLHPLGPLVQEQPQQPTIIPAPTATTSAIPSTSPAEPLASPQGVITVETLAGERHMLQFTCYPYVGTPLAAPSTPEIPSTPAATTTPDVSVTPDRSAQRGVPKEATGATGGPSAETSSEVSAQGTAEATTLAGVAGERRSAEGSTQRQPPQPPAQQQQQSGEVPLVLILIRDVTSEVRQHEQYAYISAYQSEVSAAAQVHARTELEASVAHLQSELARVTGELTRQSGINRSLLEGNQRLATANLALRTANEQLQFSEEEAEAGAEEVKTLNEELQASNEELTTLNEELEATVEELHTSNDELEARSRELQALAAKLEATGQDGGSA